MDRTDSKIDTPMARGGSGPVRWQPIADAGGYLAPEREEVWTKIDDDRGERNIAKLTRRGNLWFTDPRDGMYVYYTPTHWARL